MIKLAATFSTIQAAYIAKGMLENHGIMSIINNEDFNSIYPIGFNSIGGVRLLVNEPDLNRAKQLLEEFHDDED